MLVNYKTDNIIKNLLEKYKVKDNNVTYICQKDFLNGTYIIDKPGIYEIKENIIFNPNIDNKGKPYNKQRLSGPYSDENFTFGFFACIHINSSDVYLNLNGKSIEMGKLFRLFNRFGSIISITENLFNKNQGPAGKLVFTEDNNTLKNINIIGSNNNCIGKLLNSTHHGIRANNIDCLKIYNIDISNFEVAGISLSGCSNVFLNKLLIHDTTKDTIVNDRFSQFIIITEQLKKLNNILEDIEFKTYLGSYSVNDILTTNLSYIEEVYSSYINNTEYDGIFKNSKKIPIGNVYGIAISSKGVIVGDFKNTIPDTYVSKNIVLDNICIYNLESIPEPMRALEFKCETNDNTNKIMGCPCSNIITNNCWSKLTSGSGDMLNSKFNISDPLHMSQCLIMYISKYHNNINNVSKIVRNANFCIGYYKNCVLNNYPISSIVNNCNIRLSDPTIKIDSMNHILKANMGIFIQQSKNILLNNIKINNIDNFMESDKTYGLNIISSMNIIINQDILKNITNINGWYNGIYEKYSFSNNNNEPLFVDFNLYKTLGDDPFINRSC